MEKRILMAECTREKKGDGAQYTFFCQLCGKKVYTTDPLWAENLHKEEGIARREARYWFNRCLRCRRWVCDECYNENKMQCTECAPRTCPQCGGQVAKGEQFCTCCGARQFETQDSIGDREKEVCKK